MSSQQAMIVMSGLGKSFGAHRAVDSIDFEVHEGEIFGFLGPNGAGKSTTINMLSTLLRPTRGRAELAGYDLVNPADRRAAVDRHGLPGPLARRPAHGG